MTQCKIVIVEKPSTVSDKHSGSHVIDKVVHEILFSDQVKARKAHKQMVAFWECNGHDAIKVEGDDKIVTVSADMVTSVTLFIGEKKVAQKKKGVK